MLWREWPVRLALSVIPLLCVEGLRLASGAPVSPVGILADWLYVTGVLFLARLGGPVRSDAMHAVWSWRAGIILGVGALAWGAYAWGAAMPAVWIALAVWLAFLIDLDDTFAHAQKGLYRWGARGLLALAAGAVPVGAAQLESRFSDEEFFALLQAILLSVLWVLLLSVWYCRWRRPTSASPRGFSFRPRWLAVGLGVTLFVGLLLTLRAYQQSFFPPQAPGYPGISAEAPFLCGTSSPDSQTFDGAAVFRQLIARVEANPLKGVPEYGMLTLATGQEHWANEFRSGLLSEARQGLFTGPANSVKSVQFDAAVRAYYFSKVRSTFPSLFSDTEEASVRQWFASINRRAQTVEWVDGMYALAFSKWPEGPYENQENGAGLLAILESARLAAPDLTATNRAYLERDPRGWAARFRNTDDTFVYQPEWIDNSLFQLLYTRQLPNANTQRAFEWMLLQALPGGVPPTYNHPGSISLEGIAYLGARLLDDPRYLWLSGQALASSATGGEFPFAQPGVEQSVAQLGRSPSEGSCLLYGDSGLPNQVGPLAPDKIVFRNGWSADATYMLLNLRFTGWHRYKATNTLSLLFENGPLIVEEQYGKPVNWLPEGRSLFRDKRIPRENLNGLLVERGGMGAALYELTGIGSHWAEDPPYFARVERFETTATVDTSSVLLDNWHGWQHRRTVYFYHAGPIVIADEAQGPAGSDAALVWQTAGNGGIQQQRITLRGGDHPAEMRMVPVVIGGQQIQEISSDNRPAGLRVLSRANASGKLRVITVFLLDQWVGAQMSVGGKPEQPILTIRRGENQITVPLPFPIPPEELYLSTGGDVQAAAPAP